MAQAVTVQHGDTITSILKSRSGLQEHEIHSWLPTLRRINPHISNLDRIYPGESILIPETLNESVLRHWIWQNAFSNIPQALKHHWHGPHQIYFVQQGDTIDKVAQYMFSSGPHRTMAASNKRALLIHNNPYLENHLAANRLPMKMLLNITPIMLNEFDRNHWQREQTPLRISLDQMEADIRDMFREAGPEQTVSMAQLVKILKSSYAAVGKDDIIKTAGYGIAGVSGHAAASSMALSDVNSLARELYIEAIEKFGRKIVHSKSTSHLAKMQSFLKGHPRYAQLMLQIQNLPKHLFLRLPRDSFKPANPLANNAVARHFRKQVALPLKKWGNSSKYVHSVAKQLNGRLSLFKGVGRHATWYIPAVLGLYNVYDAPPEMKVRTLFEEGFGIFGGAAGTAFGAQVVGLSLVVLLGLGPLGAFVVVFICASAFGILGNEIGKGFGEQVYDLGNRFEDRIFHSEDELMGAF